MPVTDIIAKKRDGKELSSEEIAEVVRGLLSGTVSEGQMGALLMAMLLRGMTEGEVAELTQAMTRSGDTLDLSAIPGIKVDKHSTGGVGDKTTLVVAPLVAALGVPVPKMSGLALGHTGGTIDKLECIPGLSTRLTPTRFCQQVAEIGVAIASQSDTMTPADGRIYALRDATATVESIPLIAASVMCKKLAVGAEALMLDVKVGAGAFMTEMGAAQELARLMVAIGRRAGRQVAALITRMEEPLGAAVGDVVELNEAVSTLAGQGPSDFTELCEVVAGYMVALGGAARDPEEGRLRAREGLQSGLGLAKLKELVQAQGGDPIVLDDVAGLLQGTESAEIRVKREGCITAIDAREIGLAMRDLRSAAGGRRHQCGVILRRKVGDWVETEAVGTVTAPTGLGEALQRASDRSANAFRVGSAAPPRGDLVLGVVIGGAAEGATRRGPASAEQG